jgi:uncharacterized protein (DUF305 family)
MRICVFVTVAAIAAVPTFVLAQSDSPADQAFMDAMQAMMHNMEMGSRGDADEDFVMMMVPHHQGAIDMAKVELQYGKDPMLRNLAQSIISAQEKEIAEMKEWQVQHGK